MEILLSFYSYGLDVGVLVTSLSILVTFLLAWDIRKSIGIEKDIETLKHDINIQKKKLQNQFDSLEKKNNEQIRLTMVSVYYSMYLSFNSRSEYPGAITSIIECIYWMLKNAEDEENNLKNTCGNFVRVYNEYDRLFYKLNWGSNNCEILNKTIPKIKANPNYKLIKGDINETLIAIELKIIQEEKERNKKGK